MFSLIGYAIGSVEGRIGVEYFNPSPEIQDKKYAFKCHRQNIEDVDHVWPVNALAFHPVYVSSRSF
jgi:cell cycle arrest protein BUB3